MGRSSASPSWMRRASSAKRAPTFSVLRSIARTWVRTAACRAAIFWASDAPAGAACRCWRAGSGACRCATFQPRRRQALVIDADPQTGHVTRPRASLRVVVFVRTEPAFEDVAVLALEVENFECHGVYMRITRQNTRKRAQTGPPYRMPDALKSATAALLGRRARAAELGLLACRASIWRCRSRSCWRTSFCWSARAVASWRDCCWRAATCFSPAACAACGCRPAACSAGRRLGQQLRCGRTPPAGGCAGYRPRPVPSTGRLSAVGGLGLLVRLGLDHAPEILLEQGHVIGPGRPA